MSEFGNSESTLVAGTLFGLRTWALCGNTLMPTCWNPDSCYSYVWNKPWRKGLNTSQCVKTWQKTIPDDHIDVSMKCTCGFYAYFLSGTTDIYSRRAGSISGVIEGWGKVVAGRRGFRCHFATPRALFIPPVEVTRYKEVDATAIAEKYDIPLFNSQEDMLAEFPVTYSNPFEVEED